MSDGVIVAVVRKDEYRDSGSLMTLSRALEAEPGVRRAGAIMATQRNVELMTKLGLAAPEALDGVRPSDLVIAVEADTAELARAALARVDDLLARRGQASHGGALGGQRPARSLAEAKARTATANLALISVPGPYAAFETRRALDLGLNVLLFSNGVSIEDEVRLKRHATERGLLVMGPDCGTAIIDGAPLGFANVVPRGVVGVVGASGTGTQEVTTLLARAGVGTAQAIGTGGRDLSDDVGGITALAAIAKLGARRDVALLMIVSKPPSDRVASRILEAASATGKPVVLALLGAEDGERSGAPIRGTLEGGVIAALERLGKPADFGAEATTPAPALATGMRVVGLFTGGTLASEALVIIGRACEAASFAANVKGPRVRAADAGGDTLIDLGEDEFTRGRPHPMIDPTPRTEALRTALADPSVGLLLVDVVLGHGSHADPAGELVRALEGRPSGLSVVASITGTEDDPQVRSAQLRTLERAGIVVRTTNASAARTVAAAIAARDGR